MQRATPSNAGKSDSKSDRACRFLRLVALSVVLVTLAVLCWRVTLPNNQHRSFNQYGTPSGETVLLATDGYDDVATLVTAFHFARDGFWATQFLPNRGRAPQVSLLDFSQTQCERRSQGDRMLRYVNPFGRTVEMPSLTDDCIYAHYPPLADWWFGVMRRTGFGEIAHFRLVAVMLNGLFLVLAYVWLRREISEFAACVAVAVTATMPGFFLWADALFFHAFQSVILIAGMICWRRFLADSRPLWFLATWILFFLEALVSYDYIVFFAVVIVVHYRLERPLVAWSKSWKHTALMAVAPVAATVLHFGLRISLLGLEGTLANARSTLRDRVVEGISWYSVKWFVHFIHIGLLSIYAILSALLIIIVTRRIMRQDMRRALSMLGLMFFGGLSYSLVFPGTSLAQAWMKFRHFLPFAMVLVGYLVDCLPAVMRRLSLKEPSRYGFRALLIGILVVAPAILASSLHHNLVTLRDDINWQRACNSHSDPRNHATRSLDVLYWSDASDRVWDDRLHMPVDGRRVNWPDSPDTRFAMRAGLKSNYEIWWLEETEMSEVGILTDQSKARELMGNCSISTFDGEDFRPLPAASTVGVSGFSPDQGERPTSGYLWVRYYLNRPHHTRAARLTCDSQVEIPLHEIEVLSG